MSSSPVERSGLDAASCWEPSDLVRSRPAMTEFRQRSRLHHARWREARSHPLGTEPIVPKPGKPSRPVGSRLPLEYATATGASFVTAAARDAVRERTARTEPHQSFDHQRLWSDLLWSSALAFNLFGEVAADPSLADDVVHAWFPDAPGRVAEVRFVHSPGRLDPDYLNSLRDFAAAFVLDLGDGTMGLVAVDTRYHEIHKPERPKPENRAWYEGVATRSGLFAPEQIEHLLGRSDECVMWLEHLLLLSMLQHPSGRWRWGRYVTVRPAGNVDLADRTDRYAARLGDPDAYLAVTLEQLLDSGVLPAETTTEVRERYVVPGLGGSDAA